MRHVQRLGSQGGARTISGVIALVAGLALFGVARAPVAVGQLVSANVVNGGSGSASTGGNSAAGNSSSNSTSEGPGTSGGLLAVDLSLGGPSNTSTGSATVDTGEANASGNQSETGVNQATVDSGGPASPFGHNVQSANVTNAGDASASTGGNTAVGNNSTNSITTTNPGPGGLIAGDVNLGPGPANTSTGTAAIETGPANASGNRSTNAVNQAQVTDFPGGSGSGGGGGPFHSFFVPTPFHPGHFPGTVSGFGTSFDPCSGRFFPFSPFFHDNGQRATVSNVGSADASTGNNTAVGNDSTNTSTINQTASGGLIGLNVNLGSPTNVSDGTATINTGPANASGNESSTTVNQFCGPPPLPGAGGGQPFIRNPITGTPIVVPAIPTPPPVHPKVKATGTLARTGFESGMAVLAAGLVLMGVALLVSSRRRVLPARASRPAVTATEWDSVVRW